MHSNGTNVSFISTYKKVLGEEHHYILPTKTSYKSVFLLIISYLNLSNFEEFCVRFEVFTVVTMKNSVFQDMMLCTLLKVTQHFGGTLLSPTSELKGK
jgi:hypothetical protein